MIAEETCVTWHAQAAARLVDDQALIVLTRRGEVLVLNVLGKPSASKDAIGKPKGTQLKISVTAAPVNGTGSLFWMLTGSHS